MSFYSRLIQNHPLANIAFAVVIVMGALAYLAMPREQVTGEIEIGGGRIAVKVVGQRCLLGDPRGRGRLGSGRGAAPGRSASRLAQPGEMQYVACMNSRTSWESCQAL